MHTTRLWGPVAPIARGLVLTVAAAAMAGIVAIGAPGCADVADRDATSFAFIHGAIIGPNCATSNCHSALAATAGLEFNTKEAAYAYLTGRTCDAGPVDGEAPGNFVVPFQPEHSKLMYLLRGDEVPSQMPPDLPLPQSEIDLIEEWILSGAECE